MENTSNTINNGSTVMPVGEDPGRTLGILGIIFAFIFTILGLILGIISRSKSKKAGHSGTLGTVAIVLNIIFMILGLLFAILIIAASSTVVEEIDSLETNSSAMSSEIAQDTNGNSSGNESSGEDADITSRSTTGVLTTIGAGSFLGGSDVEIGLYDVTGAVGESGNFIISGLDGYNEILGGSFGVQKVRAQIEDGDEINISGLSAVTFTPVDDDFVTDYAAIDIYSGTFVVGQDVAAGRYVATPGVGESGNFITDGLLGYNEILGGDFGVPELTVSLEDGDVISISGLDTVTLTPTN